MTTLSSNTGLPPDSDSDFSDPTFEPSSSPRPESSTQARIRQQRTQIQRRRDLTARFRSSPPVVSSSSGSRLHRAQAHAQPNDGSLLIPQNLDSLLPESDIAATSPLRQQVSSDSSSPSHPLLSPQAQQQPSTGSPPNKKTQPQIRLRPNTYHGPASTYRNWTTNERTIVQSLSRMRAQDLAIHLFNVYALETRAKAAKAARGDQSRSRSRSRSQSRSQVITSRSRSRSRSGLNKGKARASSNENEDKEDEEEEEITFAPPRIWTAWPLPPTEVPREQLLPGPELFGTGGYRKTPVTRPSAELEECLIACLSRVAKERWEAREWASESDSVSDEGEGSGRGRKRRRVVKSEDLVVDVSMDDDDDNEGGTTGSSSSLNDDEDEDNAISDSEEYASDSSTDPNSAIPMFSSQVFHHNHQKSPSPSPSPSQSSPGTQKPVFTADDDRLRHLLTPATRQVMDQLEKLLGALHRVQVPRQSRKKSKKPVPVGTRGYEEILDLAAVFFRDDVVERARGRCAALFNLDNPAD